MPSLPEPLYTTRFGSAYVGDSLELLAAVPDESVDLVMTSPPFALQRKKEYGNREQLPIPAALQASRSQWPPRSVPREAPDVLHRVPHRTR